ncbi:MAG TPA: ribokinase [Blastocatellia bacterium]|nr:ribokinase [Blastocatellia bacterium]
MQRGIVVVGSLNADFVAWVPRFPAPGETVTGDEFAVFPGGKGANQAYAAARLGANVSMVGQVGNDPQAEFLRENLASAGVDVSRVRRDPDVSSGIAIISIDDSGQNQIVVIPGANGTFSAERLEQSRERIASAAMVLLQLEIPLETVTAAARYAKEGGATVMLDPAPALAISDDLLRLADYLTPNESELARLTGTSPEHAFDRPQAARKARELLARGANRVIVKMGAAGALLVDSAREVFWPAFPVTAVDTTAAGDAFNAAFAVALSWGKPEEEAGRFATAAAACSVTRKGAQPGMPTLEEVERLLALTCGR